jgi:peptidyl-prolyl cis-trans isomerase SurA
MHIRWDYSAVIALLFLIISGNQASGEVVNRIAAIVNDGVITTNQIERKLVEYQAKPNTPPASDLELVRRRILDSLIEETLVDQRIKELKIQVTDAEIEAAIRDVERSNNLNREQLKAALLQQGMTFEEYREKLRTELLRMRLLSKDVRKKIMVTEKEVLDYFREHIDDYRQDPFLRLGYLNFAVENPLERDQIRAQALDIQKKLRSGTGFDEILRSVAEENTITGGSLGEIKVGEMSPFYAEAVRELKEGEVSELLESPDTLRLLYVEERNPGEVKKFDDVRYDIEKKLTDQRTEERFKEWAEELKEEARVEILL